MSQEFTLHGRLRTRLNLATFGLTSSSSARKELSYLVLAIAQLRDMDESRNEVDATSMASEARQNLSFAIDPRLAHDKISEEKNESNVEEKERTTGMTKYSTVEDADDTPPSSQTREGDDVWLTISLEDAKHTEFIADNQNLHSITIAIRALVELYKVVNRQEELHREILGLTISHDDSSIRIYAHYPYIPRMLTS